MRPKRALPVLLLLALAAAIVSIHGRFSAPGLASGSLEVASRFLEEDPRELFDPEVAFQDVAWQQSFEPPLAPEKWQLGAGDLPAAQELAARRYAEHKRLLSVRRAVAFEASGTGAVRVRVRGAVPVALLWAGPGQGFALERRIDQPTSGVGPSGIGEFLFPTFGNPTWRGPIERLWIVLGRPGEPRESSEPVEVLDLTGFAAGVRSPTALKVDVDGEVRNAWVTSPGQIVERKVSLPPGAELHFAYAALCPKPVGFVVSMEDRGARREVFEEWIHPVASDLAHDDPASSRWRRAIVDFADVTGEGVTVRLETRAGGGSQAVPGLALWAHPEVLAPRSGPAPPNVVLVSVDTLRADRLSLYGNPRPTSPHLDAWARRSGVTFAKVVASAPWTLPSHASMLSGLDAHRHGFRQGDPVADELTLISEVFRQGGYATLAATGGGLLHPRFRFTQGFDVYRYFRDRSAPEPELASNVDRALEWLHEVRGRSFFLFFHTYEVHSPYTPRQPYFGRFSAHDPSLEVTAAPGSADRRSPYSKLGNVQRFVLLDEQAEGRKKPLPPELESLPIDIYDSKIAHLDRELYRLLAGLRELGLDERTIVVVTSDHGELLGEQGMAGHGSLHDTNLLVPLVIAAPGVSRAGRVVEEQVRSVDVVPTILELAGRTVPSDLDGVSLRSALAGQPLEMPPAAWSSEVHQGISLRWRNRFKYVVQPTPGPSFGGPELLFDLARDPGEEHDLAARAPGKRDELRTYLREKLVLTSWWQGRPPARPSSPLADADVRAQLRALGYLD